MPKQQRQTKVVVSLDNNKKLFGDLFDHLANFTQQEVEDTSKDLFYEIRRRTPVDTGNARDSWEFHKDANGDISIVNDVDYIIYLEEGSSQQAPSGMVRTSIAKVIK